MEVKLLLTFYLGVFLFGKTCYFTIQSISEVLHETTTSNNLNMLPCHIK